MVNKSCPDYVTQRERRAQSLEMIGRLTVSSDVLHNHERDCCRSNKIECGFHVRRPDAVSASERSN